MRSVRTFRYGELVMPGPTPRLRFREMVEDDVSKIATLEIGGSRGPAGWIEWNRRNYEEYGFGLWVLETLGGEFIGDCGLTMQEVEGTWFVEAGWHIRAERRCCGYATEAAVEVREAARSAGITQMIAIIRPHNIASQRVAANIGLVFDREVDKGGPAWIFGAHLRP